MKVRRFLIILCIVTIGTTVIEAQSKSAILDLVERSVTECDSSWKPKSVQKRPDHAVKTGRFEWTKEKSSLSVDVTAFPWIDAAIREFKTRGDSTSPTIDINVIAGLGDDAQVLTDKVNSLVAVGFRKTGANILVISEQRSVALSVARCIANAIPSGEAYSKLVPDPPSDGDFCHVYVVDVEKARKADNKNSNKNDTSRNDVETVFPEFRTDIGEETLTTKTFPFPKSRLIITASVYYTDESMASKRGVDSVLLGIVVAPTAKKSALSEDDNAFAETTFFDRDTLRVKKYQNVNGRRYLIGIQCRSNGHNSLP
jgi:hypothetical protein